MIISELDQYWEDLINYGVATNEELSLITSINGYYEQTLNDVLYVRTDLKDYEQFKEEIKNNDI